MKNSANNLILLSILFGIFFSCSNRSIDDQNSNDSIAKEYRSGSSTEGLPDNDSTINFRDGVNVNEGFEKDTVQLPKPILDAIENNNSLKTARIGKKVMISENGATFYEVVFFQANGKEEKVTFDAQGNRKQKP